MSHELNQALEEQERAKTERDNSRWNRFVRKTWIHTRADCSLYIFSPKNRLRIHCLRITQKKWFDYTILAFIGINCVT
jgi:voltage-dependent calcium channel T type alpha-1G